MLDGGEFHALMVLEKYTDSKLIGMVMNGV